MIIVILYYVIYISYIMIIILYLYIILYILKKWKSYDYYMIELVLLID